MDSSKRFKAFISYSRQDEQIASWLQHSLERFSTPKDLVGSEGAFGSIPKNLRPIFRDRTDLSGGGELIVQLASILAESEFLIVLCSPNSAKSVYVNEEVDTFLAARGAEFIFPVIVAGEPNSIDPSRECFPPSLRNLNILSADFRNTHHIKGRVIGDGRDGGRLKLIAGLLGVDLDLVIQRERQRQRTINVAIGTAATVFFILALASIAGGSLAYLNGQKATATLDRVFIAAGRADLDRGDPLLAIRHALAGHELSPNNPIDTAQAEDLLASAYDAMGENQILDGDMGAVKSAAISRDGSLVVTASSDDTARVWIAATGEQKESLKIATPYIQAANLTSDGMYMLVVWRTGEVNGIELFEVSTRKVIWRHGIKFSGNGITDISFSRDGSRFLTVGPFDNVGIWDTGTGKLIRAFHTGEEEEVGTARFSPDGLEIVTASPDGTARVWDAKTGQQVGAPLRGHTGFVTSADFSPDGRKIVTTGTDKTVRIWNARTHRQIGHPLLGHTDIVTSAAFSPDGNMIASVGYDRTIRLWLAARGEPIGVIAGHGGNINSVAFSANGRDIVTASDDGTARVWAINGKEQINTGFPDQGQPATTSMISPDSRRILVSNGIPKRSLNPLPTQVFDLLSGQKLLSFDVKGSGISDSAYSPDGRRIATIDTIEAINDQRSFIRVWNADNGSLISTFPLNNDSPKLISYSPGGRQFLISLESDSDDGGKLLVVNAETGKPAVKIELGKDEEVQTANFSPDSNTITAVVDTEISEAQPIRIWDANTGKPLAQYLDWKDDIGHANFSPDGRFVVTSSHVGGAINPDQPARIWDLQTGKQILTLRGTEKGERSASFSPDGNHIVTVGDDGLLRIWDARTGQELGERGRGFDEDSAVFSPDNQTVISVGNDQIVHVWSVKRLTDDWQTSAKDACSKVLGSQGRFFSSDEIDADPILQSEWHDPKRSVCP